MTKLKTNVGIENFPNLMFVTAIIELPIRKLPIYFRKKLMFRQNNSQIISLNNHGLSLHFKF